MDLNKRSPDINPNYWASTPCSSYHRYVRYASPEKDDFKEKDIVEPKEELPSSSSTIHYMPPKKTKKPGEIPKREKTPSKEGRKTVLFPEPHYPAHTEFCSGPITRQQSHKININRIPKSVRSDMEVKIVVTDFKKNIPAAQQSSDRFNEDIKVAEDLEFTEKVYLKKAKETQTTEPKRKRRRRKH